MDVGESMPEKQKTFANADVLAFYRELPFNFRQTPQAHAAQIRNNNQILGYPPIIPLLNKKTSLLDVGCGAGWFSLTAAYHYGCQAFGIDFNDVVVERAAQVAEVLQVPAHFQAADLFEFEPARPFDLVVSIGALHHTNNCQAAIERVCRFVSRGGHIFIGLYHLYGRRSFLNHFQLMASRGATEHEMLKEYKRLHPSLGDDSHVLSWFRDQVLHPHETQHTLKELIPILQNAGVSLISTSINGFARIERVDTLFEVEQKLDRVGAERLAQGRYYPGFFVFLAKKN